MLQGLDKYDNLPNVCVTTGKRDFALGFTPRSLLERETFE